jgi:hypothetical protein
MGLEGMTGLICGTTQNSRSPDEGEGFAGAADPLLDNHLHVMLFENVHLGQCRPAAS